MVKKDLSLEVPSIQRTVVKLGKEQAKQSTSPIVLKKSMIIKSPNNKLQLPNDNSQGSKLLNIIDEVRKDEGIDVESYNLLPDRKHSSTENLSAPFSVPQIIVTKASDQDLALFNGKKQNPTPIVTRLQTQHLQNKEYLNT